MLTTITVLLSACKLVRTSNMSAPAPASASGADTTVVDLFEGMDDLDVESQSGAEDVDGQEETKPDCGALGMGARKKKARKNRRGGKSKKTKAMEKKIRLSKIQEEQHEDGDECDGTLRLFAIMFRWLWGTFCLETVGTRQTHLYTS